MFEVILTINFVFLFFQLLLSGISYYYISKLETKFNFTLSSKMAVSKMLEVYSRVFGSIDIRVNADIKSVSIVGKDILLVNRRGVYRVDLYANCLTIWNLICVNEGKEWLPTVRIIQKTLLLFQLIILGIGFYLSSLILISISALVAVGLLGGGVYLGSKYDVLVDILEDRATDILDLDSTEHILVRSMGETLSADRYLYPLELIKQILSFVWPF